MQVIADQIENKQAYWLLYKLDQLRVNTATGKLDVNLVLNQIPTIKYQLSVILRLTTSFHVELEKEILILDALKQYVIGESKDEPVKMKLVVETLEVMREIIDASIAKAYEFHSNACPWQASETAKLQKGGNVMAMMLEHSKTLTTLLRTLLCSKKKAPLAIAIVKSAELPIDYDAMREVLRLVQSMPHFEPTDLSELRLVNKEFKLVVNSMPRREFDMQLFYAGFMANVLVNMIEYAQKRKLPCIQLQLLINRDDGNTPMSKTNGITYKYFSYNLQTRKLSIWVLSNVTIVNKCCVTHGLVRQEEFDKLFVPYLERNYPGYSAPRFQYRIDNIYISKQSSDLRLLLTDCLNDNYMINADDIMIMLQDRFCFAYLIAVNLFASLVYVYDLITKKDDIAKEIIGSEIQLLYTQSMKDARNIMPLILYRNAPSTQSTQGTQGIQSTQSTQGTQVRTYRQIPLLGTASAKMIHEYFANAKYDKSTRMVHRPVQTLDEVASQPASNAQASQASQASSNTNAISGQKRNNFRLGLMLNRTTGNAVDCINYANRYIAHYGLNDPEVIMVQEVITEMFTIPFKQQGGVYTRSSQLKVMYMNRLRNIYLSKRGTKFIKYQNKFCSLKRLGQTAFKIQS